MSIGQRTSGGGRNAPGHRREIQLWEVTGLRADYSGSREPRASVSRASRTSSRKKPALFDGLLRVEPVSRAFPIPPLKMRRSVA